MTKKWNIGIDIGGTKVNIGIVDDDGYVLDNVRLLSTKKDQVDAFLDEIYESTLRLLQKNNLSMDDVCFIGTGVPGTVDSETGFVEFCPNLTWIDIPIGEKLEARFGKKVIMGQDVRLAALAEFLFGAGKEYSDILCVVVGTGIGGGIILNGKIFGGFMNTAGEIGHMIFEKNGRRCACGARGCLERYASGTGILERALEVMDENDFHGLTPRSETVFQLANEGNLKALKVIDDSVSDLAVGIANAVDLLSPQAVIVGGGVSENEKLYVDPLKKYISQYGYYSWKKQNKLQVRKAELGSDAAMIGAAVLYKGL